MTPTIVFIISVFIIIVATNVYFFASSERYTISSVLRAAGERWAWFSHVLAFGMGILMGHWFW